MNTVTKIKELKKEFTETRKQFQEKAHNLLKEAFAELFVKHPKLENFSWTQATRYNDEEYVFRVDYYDPTINGVPEYEQEGDFYQDVVLDIRQILCLLDSGECEDFFGNSVRVIVTKEKIEIEDYCEC